MKQIVNGILIGTLMAGTAMADGGVTFTDIADGGGAGITYQRTPSPRQMLRTQVLQNMPSPTADFFSTIRPNLTPQKGAGAPGVAVLDYDRDGDLDIYVTNGPGSDNSLYQNQLVETGVLEFVDVGAASGTSAAGQDSSGVCYGDLDNDGDHDLYVLGTGEPNRLFKNNGDGTFNDVTVSAGVGAGNRHPVACTMLDADNDGLLDIVIGNSYDNWDHRIAVFGPGSNTYAFMEHNQLFMNQGYMTFTDEGAARGLENVQPLTGVPGTTGAAFTWAIGSADYDRDGDVDIFSMDNQGPAPSLPEEERGQIRIYNNDGNGFFTEVTLAAGTNIRGGWMGVDFADFNCDGNMDFFATDLGYIASAPSRWFTGNPDGTFTDSFAGPFPMIMNSFGWGVSTFDYDNDADADVIYHGSVDLTNLFVADNAGALLQNTGNCTADFVYDTTGILKNHNNRMAQGVAVGDLNNDGFEDILTVSSTDTLRLNFFPIPGFLQAPTGSVFDQVAAFELTASVFTTPGMITYVGPQDVNGTVLPHNQGTLTVEINSADNGNGWIQVDAIGTKWLTYFGDVNRDGIGAVISFTPEGGLTSMQPVVGGASYASQNALAANFGLGAAEEGVVDVEWPGGVSNRLYDVENGETVLFPEIPCDFKQPQSFFGYAGCVIWSLAELRWQGVISGSEKRRLRKSAFKAYFDEHF